MSALPAIQAVPPAQAPEARPWLRVLGLVAVAAVLTFATVYVQWFVLGNDFIEKLQNGRHRRVLLGISPDPWQYRVLSEFAIHAVIQLFQWMGVERPIVWGFLAFRAAQNLAIFLLAVRYYRLLGLGDRRVLLGLGAIAWAMTNALYDSDLSPSTYSDVILYLLAGLAVLNRGFIWIVPLAVCAALNRETGALIPVMAIAVGLRDSKAQDSRQAIQLGIAGAALFAATYLGVRAFLGPRRVFYAHGHPPGLDVALANLARLNSWARLVVTGGVFPLLAALAYRSWPPLLRLLALAILPAWTVAHLLASVVAETRLFLAPLALVVIPAGLFAFGEPRERVIVVGEGG